MSIRNNLVIVFTIIGVICFFVGIALFVISAIRDDIDFIPFIVGFVLVIACPLIGVALDSRSGRGSGTSPSVTPTVSPAERFEGGPVRYCPFCHASLGSDVVNKCPECGATFNR